MKRQIICMICFKHFTSYYTAKFCSKKCQGISLKGIKKIPLWDTMSEEKKIEYLKRKFEERVIKKEGCWDWKGARYENGYAGIQYNGKRIRAHRASWMIYNGEIPKDKSVCHKCDNPPCTNIDHLFLGTHKENMQDMTNKNRHYLVKPSLFKGDECAWSKLTSYNVIIIKRLIREGIKPKYIAERFNVSYTTIKAIKNGYSWRHIVDEDNLSK